MIGLFAGSTVDLGVGLAWLAVGLVFGCLAGSLIGRGGYGPLGDGLALVGALVGGLLLEFFSNDTAGLGSGMIVAFLGACVLIGLQRFNIREKTRRTGKALHRVTPPVQGAAIVKAAQCAASKVAAYRGL